MDGAQGNSKNQEDQSFYRNHNEEPEEENTVAYGGCLRNLLCFHWWRTNDLDVKFLLNHGDQRQKESWLGQRLKSVKEASEVLAGPKWKNFIRKFGGYFSQGNKKCSKTRLIQYDSHSYALNFDDQEQGDIDRLFVGFSARFAPLKHDQRLPGL